MKIKVLGQYAVFQGRKFGFECHNDGYWLISDDPNDVHLGFVPASGVENRFVMKGIDLNQLSFLFEKVTYAYYDGRKFQASRITDDAILLNFSSQDLLNKYTHQNIDVIAYDRNDYYMYVPIKFITRIEQEWITYTPPIRPRTE